MSHKERIPGYALAPLRKKCERESVCFVQGSENIKQLFLLARRNLQGIPVKGRGLRGEGRPRALRAGGTGCPRPFNREKGQKESVGAESHQRRKCCCSRRGSPATDAHPESSLAACCSQDLPLDSLKERKTQIGPVG